MFKYIVSFIFIFSFVVYSNELTLVLQGRVFDGETLEPLAGATVQILEIAKGTFTDTKGRFRIANVKPSKYSLKVSYIGYQTKVINNFEADKESDITIHLYPEIKSTQEVTVEATRVMDNEAAMLTAKRNSGNLMDGISITEIKRLPDKSLTSALKRVSGVTMFNDFILVRGVGERYNNATLNGVTLPSTETDKRAFSFDLYPGDFVENVNLIKSFTPDLPGTFAGGLIQLNTVDFPSSKSFRVSVGSKSNSLTTFKRNSFIGYEGGRYDWLGIDDGTRKLPSDFPSNRREFNNLLVLANNPFDTTDALNRYEGLARSLSNKTLKTRARTITPVDNKNFNVQFSNSYELGEFLLGVTANGLYSTEGTINALEKVRYLSNFDILSKSTGGRSIVNTNVGGLLNISIKTPENQIYSVKTSFINNSDDEVLKIEGSDIGYQMLEFKNISMHFTQKTLFNTTIQGNNYIVPLNLKFDWSLGFSRILREEPDYRRFRFSRQLGDESSPFTLEILPNQQGDGTRAGRFYSNMNENDWVANFNFEKTIEKLKIKFGGFFENKKRTFNARSITITISPNPSEEIYSVLGDYNNIDRILSPENFRFNDGLRIGEDSKLSDSYNASEQNLSGYLMFDYRFTIFNLPTRIVSGLRVEHNDIKLSSHNINDEPVNIDYPTLDFLPALNLVFMPTNNSNIRFSASRTLARPSFREFAPFAFYDYYELSLVQGNPNLKRANITNLDLRYEYFPTHNELYSVGVFYKSFENAIEETIFPQQSELTRTFANANGLAKNLGVEFELRKGLGFIWSGLENFSLVTNFALISSSIEINQGGKGTEDRRPMWGQSPYTFNLGLFYQNQNSGTLVSITYNTYGKRIVQVSQVGVYQAKDPHIYELPQNYLDVLIGQKVGMIDLRLGIKNLLNAKTLFEQNGRTWSVNKFGTTISFSISYSIF
ncbi:MAG: carboxypeptidase-like regulatory domain-containing protein [Ignavibacteria bacterium]|nr:carboxypeptidase-like regulatory domain-containing protein [Ignavibacteria bacterium]